jgi:excisionase family DNA binding protein
MSTTPPVERLAYSVAEAAQAIGVSPGTIHNLIREGSLFSSRIRDRILIRREDLSRLLQSTQADQS